MAAPVRKDEEVELQVDSLAYGGNGVARLNGFVVFVRRGLPGDRVRARITKVKRGFAESHFFYRNKLEYSFTHTPSGPALGFHKAGRWDEVLEIEKCWLTTDLGNAIRNAVRDWARAEHLEAYDQERQTGYLRHLVVREGRNTGQVLVMLVTARGERFDVDFLIETLTKFPEVRSIHWAINDT